MHDTTLQQSLPRYEGAWTTPGPWWRVEPARPPARDGILVVKCPRGHITAAVWGAVDERVTTIRHQGGAAVQIRCTACADEKDETWVGLIIGKSWGRAGGI